MLGRIGRLLPLLAAALLLALVGGGSLALAQGHGHGKRRSSATQSHRLAEHCSQRQFSAWDEQWLMMAIEGDRFEITGGRLAQQRATTQIVRSLGSTLVRDHSATLADAVVVARRLGIEVPGQPSPTQQWQLRAVAQFAGRQFDRQYADLEVQDHIQDIREAQDEVSLGCNPDVRRDAADDIPILQRHLRLAQDALRSVS
jgi:putative membrane protein